MEYKKNFIILYKEDNEYCNIGSTGYCKIEETDTDIKATLFIKDLNDGYEYNAYIANFSNNDIELVSMGVCRNGEYQYKINKKDIPSYNMIIIAKIDKFDIYNTKFPLIGYYNISKSAAWKQAFIVKTRNIQRSIEEVNKPQEVKEPEVIEDALNDDYIDFVGSIKRGDLKLVNNHMMKNSYAKEYNPFTHSKLKYNWWKISDLKFFEEIFKSSVISSQIFKHPLIKRIIKNSDHCLFGTVSDMNDKIKYIAYGFPAKYSIKDQIYIGGFSTFYSQEGYSKNNGDEGYWVMHIKVDSDNIVMSI